MKGIIVVICMYLCMMFQCSPINESPDEQGDYHYERTISEKDISGVTFDTTTYYTYTSRIIFTIAEQGTCLAGKDTLYTTSNNVNQAIYLHTKLKPYIACTYTYTIDTVEITPTSYSLTVYPYYTISWNKPELDSTWIKEISATHTSKNVGIGPISYTWAPTSVTIHLPYCQTQYNPEEFKPDSAGAHAFVLTQPIYDYTFSLEFNKKTTLP